MYMVSITTLLGQHASLDQDLGQTRWKFLPPGKQNTTRSCMKTGGSYDSGSAILYHAAGL